MLKLKCPFCGLADIDATSGSFCSCCGRRLVGSLADPYGWGLAGDVQGEAAPTDVARMQVASARELEGFVVTAAGFWLRTIAWGIDIALIATGALVLFRLPGVFLLWPGAFLYFTVCNKLGSSIGKATLGLRVISVDGRPIDWFRATLRSVSWLVSLVPMGLGLFWIGWDGQKQGWHDKVSGTMVVKPERA